MDVMADLAASNEVNTELVAVSTDSIPVHRWLSQLGMAMWIYLPMRINSDIRIIRHTSDIARYMRRIFRIGILMILSASAWPPLDNVILGLTNLASSGFGGKGGRQEVP